MSLYDIVIMTVSGTPGTGTITLNAATDGGRTFADAGVPDGATVTYAVEDGSNRELRRGVYTASGTTLTRGTLLASTTGSDISLTSAAKVFITPAASDIGTDLTDLTFFGDGSDGDVIVSTGITLTRDVYYRNLTMAAGGTITTAGNRIFVAGTLLDTGNVAGAIRCDGNTGSNGSLTLGGAGAGATTTASVAGGGAGVIGGTGATGVGATAAASAAPNNGGVSGAGGKGGNSTNAGGASRAATAATLVTPVRVFTLELRRNTLLLPGAGGPGGSGGGGDGTNSGTGGGGGGGGAGTIWLAARNIETNASTPAGWIRANGGTGGNGRASGAAGNAGGGGAGSGGGGGWVYLVYGTRTGTAVTDLITANGGTGGNGGPGIGTGLGGNGGQGGGCGRVNALCTATGVVAELLTPGGAGTTPTTATTTAGTSGTAGAAGTVTF